MNIDANKIDETPPDAPIELYIALFRLSPIMSGRDENMTPPKYRIKNVKVGVAINPSAAKKLNELSTLLPNDHNTNIFTNK